MDETYIGSRICMSKDVGLEGNLFGGIMMSWADEYASIFAQWYTGEHRIVTVKIGEINFLVPVKVNTIVRFYATDPKIGRTSVRFNLKALNSDQQVVFETHFVFVAIGNDGKPKEIKKSASE